MQCTLFIIHAYIYARTEKEKRSMGQSPASPVYRHPLPWKQSCEYFSIPRKYRGDFQKVFFEELPMETKRQQFLFGKSKIPEVLVRMRSDPTR